MPLTHRTTPKEKARLPPAQDWKHRSPCALFSDINRDSISTTWVRLPSGTTCPSETHTQISAQNSHQPHTLREALKHGFHVHTWPCARPLPLRTPTGCLKALPTLLGALRCRWPKRAAQGTRGGRQNGTGPRRGAAPRHGSAARGSQWAPEPGTARLHSFIHKKRGEAHMGNAPFRARYGALRAPPRDPQPHRYSRQSSSSLLSEQSLSSSHAQTAGMHRSFRHWNWSLSHSFTAPTRHGAAPGSAGRASPPGESRGQGRSCNRHREPPAEGRGWGWARLGGCAPREHGGVRSCFVCAWKGRCRAPCTGLGAGDKGTQG